MFEFRFDALEITDSFLEDGFLRAKVKITKPGVYPYTLADGTIRKEAKLPNEIYSKEFLKSLDGLIVTDGHPYEFGGIVNSQNYKSLIKGLIFNPRIENDFVVADEIVFDPELISSIKRGERVQVSLGCKAEYLEGGIFEGQQYDRAQTNLIGNHVAHVMHGRIGPEAKILLDGIEYAIQGEIMPDAIPSTETEPSWVKKIMEGFDKLFSLFSAKSETVVDAKVAPPMTDPAAATATSESKQVDELKKIIQAMASTLGMKMDEAMQRDSIIDTVKAVLPEINLKGLSNEEIKKQLIKSQLPELKLDSAESIDICFEASLELARAKAKLSPAKIEVVTDSAEIATLKAKRLNLYKES